jgi:proline dehydrogenase
VDRAACARHVRRLLDAGGRDGFFVRIDMENSPYTAVTLELFEELWRDGYRHAGVVLQSALYRSGQDVARMNALGARVRLVKGAYKEPKSVAYQRKADVDAAYLRLARTLLIEGTSPAIATHDPVMVNATRQFAAERGVTADRYEFQMLYGIRRDLQAALLAEGARIRIYVPFGREWFPYFMRRLGERPANVAFVARALLRDR